MQATRLEKSSSKQWKQKVVVGYFEFAIALLRPGRVVDLIEFQNTQSLSSTKSQILEIKKSTEIHQKILKKFRLFFDSEGSF